MLLFLAVVLCLLGQVGCIAVHACVALYKQYARIKFRLLAATACCLALLAHHYTADLQQFSDVAATGFRNLARSYDHLHAVAEWMTYANRTVGTLFWD